MLYNAIDKNKINAATGDFHSFFINGNKSFKYITLYKSDKKIAQAIDNNKKLIYFMITNQSFYGKFYNILIILGRMVNLKILKVILIIVLFLFSFSSLTYKAEGHRQ